jgi:hypothetical protein
MAVFLELTYGKKLGLPAYSSHSFSITLRSEVSELKDVEREASKIYCLLQDAVDRQIIEAGYTPVPLGGGPSEPHNGHGKGPSRTNGHDQSNGEAWACSPKQRDLILKIVDEHRLEKSAVENLSKEMFNAPVKTLNKMEASGLIEELLNKYGPAKSNGSGNGKRGQYQRGGSRQ